MKKTLFALVGIATLTSAAGVSARNYSNTIACSGWRDGQCVAWNRLTRDQAAKVSVGTVFGPNYTFYSDVKTLPQAVVAYNDHEMTSRKTRTSTAEETRFERILSGDNIGSRALALLS